MLYFSLSPTSPSQISGLYKSPCTAFSRATDRHILSSYMGRHWMCPVWRGLTDNGIEVAGTTSPWQRWWSRNSDSSVRAASRSLFFSEQLLGISSRRFSVVTVSVCTAFGNQRPSYSREGFFNLVILNLNIGFCFFDVVVTGTGINRLWWTPYWLLREIRTVTFCHGVVTAEFLMT